MMRSSKWLLVLFLAIFGCIPINAVSPPASGIVVGPVESETSEFPAETLALYGILYNGDRPYEAVPVMIRIEAIANLGTDGRHRAAYVRAFLDDFREYMKITHGFRTYRELSRRERSAIGFCPARISVGFRAWGNEAKAVVKLEINGKIFNKLERNEGRKKFLKMLSRELEGRIYEAYNITFQKGKIPRW